MTAIYDTMQYIPPRHPDGLLGQAASAAAVLLAAGTPGKRLALPNARILIHQPAMRGRRHGQASDIEIQADEILRMRTWLEETLATHPDATSSRSARTSSATRSCRPRRPWSTASSTRCSPAARRRPTTVQPKSQLSRPGPPRRTGRALVHTPGDQSRTAEVSVGDIAVRRWQRVRDPRRRRTDRRVDVGRRPHERRGSHVARIGESGDLLKCSFCGKSQKQVKKLIAGPGRLHLRRVHRAVQRDHRGRARRVAPRSGWSSCPSPARSSSSSSSTSSARSRPSGRSSVAVYNHYKRIQAGEAAHGDAGRRRRDRQVQHPADRPHRLRQDLPRADPGQACSTSRSPSPTPRR